MSRFRSDEGDNGGAVLAAAGVAFLLWLLSRGPGDEGGPTGEGRNLTTEEAEAIDISRMTTNQMQRVMQAPWVTKSEGSTPFMEMNQGAVTLPAIGAEVTVVQFVVPARRYGVIEFFSNQFVGGGWNEGSGDLVWRIEADGVPIQGYNNMLASIGTMSNAAPLGNSVIDVFEGQTIRLVCANVNVPAAGQNLLGMFRGRYYPLEQGGAGTWQ